jgi:purine nucleosidase/pyrimidine-specific ribonucleoside hydrolase
VTDLLIDTDPGLDDALALLYAWGSPQARVVAVTTVAGNVSLRAATLNVRRLLALRHPVPPPRVAIGAAGPLSRPLVTAARYHGEDGLGDLPDWPPVQGGAPAGPGAARVLVDTPGERPGGVTLVALGPVTNLAHALEADAGTLARYDRVVVMGGAVDVPGNVTPDAEFNAHVDPEALARVLDAGARVDLIPLDATRQAVLSRAALEDALARRPGPLAERVARFTARGFRVDAARGTPGMVLHDPLAVAAALDATLVEWEPVRLAVGPAGETRRASGTPHCRVARRVDTGRFLGLFLERLCPASSS